MSIQIAVEPTNPGQFFACCGLLELAHRLWPGAEGWFSTGEFHIACEGTLIRLLSILIMDPPEELLRLDNGLEVKPLLAPLRFSFDGGATTSLTLDAWMTIRGENGEAAVAANPPWNFWSGQQTALRIWNPMRAALGRLLPNLNADRAYRLFEQRELLTGRFGFDPGPAWTALDVGFSPNEQKISVESSPAVELLASVGIQRFRPARSDSRDQFDYFTWRLSLPPAVAAAAASGAISCAASNHYRCRVVNRGQYAALSYSTLISGGFND